MNCRLCGEQPPLKSNKGIAEERARLLATLEPRPEPSCPDAACTQHNLPLSKGAPYYHGFGHTHSGSKRIRCNACRKTFAIPTSTTRQFQPHKNRMLFTLLMNKVPFRRILEIAHIHPVTLYGKIDFLARQCQAFLADREQQLRNGMAIPRLYLSVDRQDYLVNWTQRTDRRNVILHAVGTADNTTGYLFGIHLNYDPALDADEVEAEAHTKGDYDLAVAVSAFRQYARCWLAGDYAEAIKRLTRKQKAGSLRERIVRSYEEALLREDVEVFETKDTTRRLPTRGMQIHAEYTLYGHFFYLRELFRGVEKLRFFLDQDSGMRAACLAAFQPEIQARRADAFYVRIDDDLTIDQRRAVLQESRRHFKQAQEAHPDLTENQVRLLLIKERMAEMATLGKWQDRWLTHPFPQMSEPRKAVCSLTDYGDYDQDHLAWLYNKASLHSIDAVFMQIRRRLSLLERPIHSASSDRRTWHGYSPYNPEMIANILTIFRAFYNYCLPGAGGTTPAMRLGLAKGLVDLQDIIYF